MIVQGVKHWISYIWVCHKNSPKKCRHVALTPALNLETLLDPPIQRMPSPTNLEFGPVIFWYVNSLGTKFQGTGFGLQEWGY